jgi:hypothetical protein
MSSETVSGESYPRFLYCGAIYEKEIKTSESYDPLTETGRTRIIRGSTTKVTDMNSCFVDPGDKSITVKDRMNPDGTNDPGSTQKQFRNGFRRGTEFDTYQKSSGIQLVPGPTNNLLYPTGYKFVVMVDKTNGVKTTGYSNTLQKR